MGCSAIASSRASSCRFFPRFNFRIDAAPWRRTISRTGTCICFTAASAISLRVSGVFRYSMMMGFDAPRADDVSSACAGGCHISGIMIDRHRHRRGFGQPDGAVKPPAARFATAKRLEPFAVNLAISSCCAYCRGYEEYVPSQTKRTCRRILPAFRARLDETVKLPSLRQTPSPPAPACRRRGNLCRK